MMVTSGISWNDIGRMIKEERKANNPLANLIYKINLDKSALVLMLDADEEDPNNDLYSILERFPEFDSVVKVDIDIGLSA